MPEYRLPGIESVTRSEDSTGRRIVFVVNPAGRSLEYMGPVQVFDETNYFFASSGRPDLRYRVEFVSTGVGPVFETKGLSIAAPIPYHRLRGPVDTLIFQATDAEDVCLGDERFIAWVAKMSSRVRRMVSICTGSFILAEAGVLDGRRATTHWCACDDFRRRYPRVTLERDPIYVKDGHVYTSAGATSGMDLAIALVEEDFGTEFARRVAQGLVMFLRRPGNQSQFSVQLATEPADADGTGEIESYIFENLSGDLRIDALAARFHMSPRTLIRVVTRRLGMAPGRFVEQCRLERARRYLEETDEPIAEIAARCGYSSPDGLRLAFERNLSVTPRAYRNRFSAMPGREKDPPAGSARDRATRPRV
jgi:transcriptional regulator GlxA family with amidase domain